MRLEQRLAERPVEPVGRDVHRHPVEHLAQQRVAVGVRPAGGDADQHVADADVGAGEQLVALDDADERAGDVERARRVHARHLGGLATEQGAAGRLGRPRPSRRRPRRRGRRRARWRRCSRGRTAAGADCTSTSSMQWLTMSIPTPRTMPSRAASSTFVPTPSVDATSTGSRSAVIAAALNTPPKLPTPRSTPLSWVASTAAFISATARVPSSMSTPACGVRPATTRRAPASRCRGGPACRRSGSADQPVVRVVGGPRRGRRRARSRPARGRRRRAPSASTPASKRIAVAGVGAAIGDRGAGRRCGPGSRPPRRRR